MLERRTQYVGWLMVLLGLLPAAAWAEQPELTGRLTNVDGVKVLTLWGDDYQRGFAHGYLLAEDIVTFTGQVLLDPRVVASKEVYENKVVKALLPRMEFRPRYERELEGILAGVSAHVGQAGLQQPNLGRALTVEDLKAINSLADWHAFYCSSFSVWGSLHDKNQIATARNLDFLRLPGIVEQQIVIVHQSHDSQRQSWVSVAWAGLIGCYTGMNQQGVTISIHDCSPGARSAERGFVPRSLALREAIETALAGSAIENVEQVLKRSPALWGNNIHVSRPYHGSGIPAAVLEYDSNGRIDGGVTRRTAQHNRPNLPGQVLLCTNHHRLRSPPIQCPRYGSMQEWVTKLTQSNKQVNQTNAFDMMRQLNRYDGGILTVHTVVMLPNTKEMYLSLATPEQDAPTDHIVHLKLADLLNTKR